MPALESDTICAIATASGRGGIGIVRISGDLVPELSRQLLGFQPQARHAHYCDFLGAGGRAIDRGVAIWYRRPHSYTGEDVLELQGHGSVHVLRELLAHLGALGVRIAEPGEFSQRAFLNDRIDLLQAEAIADLIDAGSVQAARSAQRTLQGEFSRQVHALVAQLTTARVNVEAAIDFSDEDIDVLSSTGVNRCLDGVLADIGEVSERARQGAILREGMNIVIAGKPNAGKSSLLNALAGVETAIVTSIPGTTRDLLKEEILVDGMPVHVTDTAGLRRSTDPVEQEGVKRARMAIEQADRLLLVIDHNQATGQSTGELLEPLGLDGDKPDQRDSTLAATTLVFNKIDLAPDPQPRIGAVPDLAHELPCIYLSARERTGIDLLRRHLKDCIGFRSAEEGVFVARERHLKALEEAAESIRCARANLESRHYLELVAEDLRLAQRALGAITGEVTSDELLGEIFAGFCVGK